MKDEDYSILLNEDFRINFLNKAISKFKNQTNLAKYLNSKIKRKKIIRENIKGWLRGKHNLGWNIMIPIKIIKELCVINSQNLDEVLKNAIKFNPPWKNPKKKKYLIQMINKPKLIKEQGKKYLDLSSILPDKTLESTRSGKKLPLFAKILNNKINLWSEANWKKSSIKLKRFIELDDLFFIGSAVYSSEGTTKIGKDNSSISIGNSEPAIINLFFKWLNSFLEDYKANVKIEFNGKKCNKEELIDFWKKNISYIKDTPIKVIIRKKYNSRLIKNRGVLNIKISNTILKSFIINLLKISKRIVLLNRIYSLYYLRGLLASEGSVSRPILKEVAIGCIKNNERKFIIKLLKKLELTFTEGKNQLSITNWKNFFFLYKNDVFNISQVNSISKKDTFNKGFVNHQTTKGLIKIKKFRDKDFKAIDWQKEFKLKKYISAHKFLKKFVENEILLTKYYKNIKIYFINHKKIDFLEKIWDLENL